MILQAQRAWLKSAGGVAGFLGLALGLALAAPAGRPATGPDAEKRLREDGKWESFPDGSTGRTTAFKGKAGLVIGAYLRKPKGKGPFPVVVLLHGGKASLPATYALGRTTRHPTADFLAAGWAIYSIDYRPHKKFFDEAEWEDTAAALEAVRRLDYVDRKRVALFGGSHGGNVICRLASRVEVCCGVPCAPAGLDLLEVAKVARRGEKVAPQLLKLIAEMEKQHGAKAEEIARSPAKFGYRSALTEVKDVRFPLLIVSGRNDEASPIPVADAYVKSLTAAGKLVETYYPDNGPHGFYFGRPAVTPETKECARRAVAFIGKHFAEGRRRPAGEKDKGAAPAAERAAKLKVALQSAWAHPDKAEPAGTQYKTFRSRTIMADVSYLIYLPPGYSSDGKKRYPVVYWLHGSGGSPRGGAVFVERLDAAIRAGKAPPTIAVLVNGLKGETLYCDTTDGKLPVESVLVKDLVPHVDATYRTIATRQGRGIEGFSMGGFGAAHLGFKYPERFGAVSILAPALLSPEVRVKKRKFDELVQFTFDGDLDAFKANDPFTLAEKNARALRKGTAIRIVPHFEPEGWLIPRCEALHKVLERHRVPHRLAVHDRVKAHSPRLLYDALGDEAIGFFTKAFAAAKAKE
jgi:endo-1,4-beta-xylanase